MKRLTWVKWYMTDWMIGVRRMSWSARGIYMEALCLQFHGERIDVGYEHWRELFQGITEHDYLQVTQHFEEREDERGGYFVNRRLEAEIDACKVKSDKAREAAKRSHSGRSANALRTHSERSAIRGEERREEENREETEDCTARKRAVPTDSISWSPIDGWQGITDKDRADWAVAYPAVAVDRELAVADQWLKANPEKARKKKWRAFLARWFGRTQERGGNRAGRVEPNAAPRRHEPDRSHIPEDCAPGQDHLFWDGTFPNIPSTYTDTAGNLRHTRTRKIICAAEA